jgi:ribosomal-protein-serine acetyltransferase
MGQQANYRTLIPLFDELKGERVLVRPYRDSDAVVMFEAIEESRAHLQQWISFDKGHQSVEQTRDWIARQSAKWQLREDMPVGIWDIGTGRYVGDTRLYPQNWDSGYFSLSYWVRASAAGKGYMTAAVELLVDFALDRLEATRLEIQCDARNTGSASLARRLGFVQEGLLRNHGLTPQGSLRDSFIFGLAPQDRA